MLRSRGGTTVLPIREENYMRLLRQDMIHHYENSETVKNRLSSNSNQKPDQMEGGEEEADGSGTGTSIKMPSPESVQADQIHSDNHCDTPCSPPHIQTNRARTKLNQRGVDLKVERLSFSKSRNQRMSESVNLDHNFENLEGVERFYGSPQLKMRETDGDLYNSPINQEIEDEDKISDSPHAED